MTHINFGTLVPLVVAIIAGGLGCVLLILSWQLKRKDSITSHWLPVQGVVLSSEVKEYRPVATTNEDQTTFAPLVRYQYICNGHTYLGIRVTFNNIRYSKVKAEQVASQYSTGDTVTVYYDPLHSEESVLEKDISNYSSLRLSGLISLALSFGSLCIAILVLWLEKALQ